jgi:hypothetical protein
MSSTPFYKRPPTTQKSPAYEWPPKRIERPVKISRQEPPPQATSVDEVKEGSRAENSGLKLGDSIVTINNVDTSNMTLQEANNVLEQASQQDVKLGVIKFDEVDEAVPDKKLTIHEILLKGKRSSRLPFEDELRPPREAYVEKAEKKSWHPIVWPHPERIAPEMSLIQQELPHKRIIRNLRRLLTEIADKPVEREKHIENLLMILPRGSADPLKAIRPKPEKEAGKVEDEDDEDEFDDEIHFVEDVSAERYKTEEEDYEDDE